MDEGTEEVTGALVVVVGYGPGSNGPPPQPLCNGQAARDNEANREEAPGETSPRAAPPGSADGFDAARQHGRDGGRFRLRALVSHRFGVVRRGLLGAQARSWWRSAGRPDLGVLDGLLPAAFHDVDQYANNVLEADHGRLKARLRPTRGLKTHASAQLVSCGHAFAQNLRRGHSELAVDVPPKLRLAQAFAELAPAI